MSYHDISKNEVPVLAEAIIDLAGGFIIFFVFIASPLMGLGLQRTDALALSVAGGLIAAVFNIIQKRKL